MSSINGTTRQLIRNLVGLQSLLESFDRLENIEQAAAELQKRVDTLRAEEQTLRESLAAAQAASDAAIKTRVDAADMQIASRQNILDRTNADISEQTARLGLLRAECDEAEEKLQNTRAQLRHLATAISG